MTDKINEVMKANEDFYLAMRSADFDRMENIWVNDDSVKCVHPGWPMLHGWEAVSESWKNIFENGGALDIELQDIDYETCGDSAWVICIEKVSYKFDGEIQHGFAQSTNIFKFTEDKWLLALHHASPIPAPKEHVSSSEVLQ